MFASPRKYEDEFCEVTVSNRFKSANANVHLRDHERLDLACVRDMRANTEIDHGSTAVYCRRLAIRNLALDEILLVRVVLYNALAACSVVLGERFIRGTFRGASPSRRLSARTFASP